MGLISRVSSRTYRYCPRNKKTADTELLKNTCPSSAFQNHNMSYYRNRDRSPPSYYRDRSPRGRDRYDDRYDRYDRRDRDRYNDRYDRRDRDRFDDRYDR